MKPERLRDYLERLNRKELEELSEQALRDRNTTAKNKDVLIDRLMDNAPKVAKTLGGTTRWWEQPSTHIYGIISVIGTVIALVAFFLQSDATPELSSIDPLRKQEILDLVERVRSSQPPVLTEPMVGRVQVDSVPPVTTSGFELLEHRVICDLRLFKPVPSVDRDKMLSPVVQHIWQRIKKVDDSKSYFLAAHTSGIDVFCSSPTHTLTVHASNERLPVAEQYTVKPRMLEFDVSAKPTGSEFTIEATKTFWNAFNNQDQSWVGINVGLPTRSISYLIVFPNDKPFTSFKHFVDDEHQNRMVLPDEHYVFEDPEKRWIWWNIIDPKPHHSYNIDWEW